MQLRYVGPSKQPYTLSLPVPFVALSDRVGEVVFSEATQWTAEVPDEYVEYLLDEPCGGIFEPAERGEDSDEVPVRDRLAEKVERAIGKKFSGKTGKWKAKAYVKQHKLDGLVELQRNAYGHWILVRPGEPVAPITPISTEVEGQGVMDEHSDRIEASVGV